MASRGFPSGVIDGQKKETTFLSTEPGNYYNNQYFLTSGIVQTNILEEQRTRCAEAIVVDALRVVAQSMTKNECLEPEKFDGNLNNFMQT
jgi:hypothetical protein